MTRPRGGYGSQGQSWGRNRGVPTNPNIVPGVFRGQVIIRGQAAANHRGVFFIAHDVIANDINEDTVVEDLEDEEGNRSNIAIWTDELTSFVLEKYENFYFYKNRRPNLSKNMSKVIVEYNNGFFYEMIIYKEANEIQYWYNEEEI